MQSVHLQRRLKFCHEWRWLSKEPKIPWQFSPQDVLFGSFWRPSLWEHIVAACFKVHLMSLSRNLHIACWCIDPTLMLHYFNFRIFKVFGSGAFELRCCPLSMVMLESCFMSKRTWWCGMLRSTHLSVDGISWRVCHTRNGRHQSQVCGPWAAAELLWWTIWFVKVWSTA